MGVQGTDQRMTEKRVRVVIHGYVQGVGFRANCARRAEALGVTGWVRNQWDGSVEALFEGDAAAVDRLVDWCRVGPSRSDVTGVEVADAPSGPPERSFRVK
jgi:acylphosphatase